MNAKGESMTLRERAKKITDEIGMFSKAAELWPFIEAVIAEAIKGERSACEEIAEETRNKLLNQYTGLTAPYHTVAEEIRDAIRARS